MIISVAQSLAAAASNFNFEDLKLHLQKLQMKKRKILLYSFYPVKTGKKVDTNSMIQLRYCSILINRLIFNLSVYKLMYVYCISALNGPMVLIRPLKKSRAVKMNTNRWKYYSLSCLGGCSGRSRWRALKWRQSRPRLICHVLI